MVKEFDKAATSVQTLVIYGMFSMRTWFPGLERRLP
jgi:hypothetical protein